MTYYYYHMFSIVKTVQLLRLTYSTLSVTKIYKHLNKEQIKNAVYLFTFGKYLHSITNIYIPLHIYNPFLHSIPSSVHGYFLEPYNNEKSHELYDKLKYISLNLQSKASDLRNFRLKIWHSNTQNY